MKVCRLEQATREIISLDSKYHNVWPEIARFERLLAANHNHNHKSIPDLKRLRDGEPASIWKARVLHPQLGGKSSGLRYVYERLWIEGEEYAIALTVYLHQQGDKEADIIKRIRGRCDEIEATAAGLRALDCEPSDP